MPSLPQYLPDSALPKWRVLRNEPPHIGKKATVLPVEATRARSVKILLETTDTLWGTHTHPGEALTAVGPCENIDTPHEEDIIVALSVYDIGVFVLVEPAQNSKKPPGFGELSNKMAADACNPRYCTKHY
jgi:hypothetical protein